MSFIEELKKERIALADRINAIDLLLKSYGQNHEELKAEPVKDKIEVDFDLGVKLKKSSTPQKFLLILKEHQRFMKIREMAKFLEVQLGGTEDDWTTKLSRTTGKLKKLNKITHFKVGRSNNNVFWGSPNWIDENGKIKSDYKYIEDAVDKAQGSLLIDI